MKVKIYLGEDVVVGTNQVNRYKLEFSGNPGNLTRIAFDIKKNGNVVENVDKTFNATTSDVSNTITGATPTNTAINLLNNLQTYNTNSITTYSLSLDDNEYGNEDIYIDVIGDIADVFTFTSISNTTSGKVSLINVGQISTYDLTEKSYNLLDLFRDENVELTSKLSDIEKLSNVFTDFSNSFSVPATANNNDIFQHYYDVDIDNTFNANIRVDGYMEIDTFPFRFGKIQLESIKLKDKKPDSYKITFYGGTIQLTDLFGDDTLNLLDYDKVITNNTENYVKVRNVLGQYDFEYNSSNFIDSIDSPDFKNGDLITPLISYADRDWNYGSNDAIDIATTSGAILDTELFQALRITKIIEAIEAKYNLSFSREFFGTATFNNLFMWLNGNETPLSVENTVDLQDALTDSGSWQPAPDIFIDDFIQLDTINDYITVFIPRIGTTVRDFADCEFWVRPLVYNLSDTNTQFKVIARNYDTGEIIAESDLRTGNDTISSTSLFLKFKQRNSDYTVRIKFSIQLYNTATFDFKVLINMYVTPSVTGPAYPDRIRQTLPNTQTITANRAMSNVIPKIKVIDFLQGIMKQFKLIIRPLSENQFYVNTLDGYYSEGNFLDITEYVDNHEITIERPEIYKTIKFKYQKTNNVLGKKFREINDPVNDEIGYGDLRSVYSAIDSKNELTVEVPFENMLFERLTVLQPSAQAGEITDWIIGQSISTSDNTTFSKNNSKPILFFDNGIVSNTSYPIKIKFGSNVATISYAHLIGNTNDELLDQVTDTINFGAEIDPWHNQIVANSLYLNYWSNWVNTIYDLKQRKFTFEGYLPPRYIEELSLNDRLIINNNRYKINDYKINLLDGKTTFTLFNDIFEWDAYSFPTEFIHNERAFTPNGWYMTDTINNGSSAYIYGSFTGYNSSSYGRIIKLLPNGDVDTTFNTGTGFNNNTFGFQSITKQPDGKILATGDFTSFNGTARNRIARLNTDGSLDTSLVVGTGFNGITSGVEVDSQGRIIVCGSYSSYSGVTSQRIIRLTSGGTIDYSTSTNGFNSVTNSVVINSDDSMYVGGYFSSYSGITSNRIIKLTSGFTVDTSFNVGTGLNSNTSTQPVGLISDGADGVYVYGHFTTYSGISQNRMTKLLPNGQIDPEFKVNFGTGFNASITSAYKVLDDKILVYGTFTEFNGLSVPNGLIVLNSNGSIYRTFIGNYVNVFTIGNRFYGNGVNGNTVLIDDESLPIIGPTTIIANAGVKFYGVIVLKNQSWNLTKVDLGYGTDWITLTTTNGDGIGECVFRIEEKATQGTPQVYEPRYMILRFNFNGIYRDVVIRQNGLEQ